MKTTIALDRQNFKQTARIKELLENPSNQIYGMEWSSKTQTVALIVGVDEGKPATYRVYEDGSVVKS